jgi:hypothetical protein
MIVFIGRIVNKTDRSLNLKMKRGEYGIYRGKEYSIILERYNRVTLRTYDKSALEEGFQIAGLMKNVYIKEVDKAELDDAYEYKPYAVYKGREFIIEGVNETDQTVILKSIDQNAVDELGFSSLGKYEFTVCVPINDLVVIEEKVEILGFRRN